MQVASGWPCHLGTVLRVGRAMCRHTRSVVRTRDESAGSRQVRMVCGACCLPDCSVSKHVAHCLQTGAPLPEVSSEFVVVECSNAECEQGGQLHRECFDKKVEELTKLLCAQSNEKRPEHQIRKLIWRDVGAGRREGKYALVRRHVACVCGKGAFKAVESDCGEVVTRGGGGAEGGAAAARKAEAEERLRRQREREEEQARAEKEALFIRCM